MNSGSTELLHRLTSRITPFRRQPPMPQLDDIFAYGE
jgi:hypothetical protein